MSSPIIVVENLVKWYGPHLAVRDVSFSVGNGEIVGLLGPNGSGKSTFFRILTGYLTPSSGVATVAGCDVASQSPAARGEVGYVPEDAPLYDHMRVNEFLRFMARLKGLEGSRLGRAVEEAVERLRLEKVLTMTVAKLSRGYRQRVAIAQALLTKPRLLVFDEPTSGLDPSQVIAVRNLIRELDGKQTVLIASHILSEIEQIASRVMILLDGKLLTADALQQGERTLRLRLRISGPEYEVRSCIATVPGVRSVSTESVGATGQYLVEGDCRPQLAQELAATLIGQGFALSELCAVLPDLEQIFLELTTRTIGVAA
jgi:ABC-2 type transport system ATP-binding protein